VKGAVGGVDAVLEAEEPGAGGAEILARGEAALGLYVVSISYFMSWASMRR